MSKPALPGGLAVALARTLTVTALLGLVLPRVSVATAVKVYVPGASGTVVLTI